MGYKLIGKVTDVRGQPHVYVDDLGRGFDDKVLAGAKYQMKKRFYGKAKGRWSFKTEWK